MRFIWWPPLEALLNGLLPSFWLTCPNYRFLNSLPSCLAPDLPKIYTNIISLIAPLSVKSTQKHSETLFFATKTTFGVIYDTNHIITINIEAFSYINLTCKVPAACVSFCDPPGHTLKRGQYQNDTTIEAELDYSRHDANTLPALSQACQVGAGFHQGILGVQFLPLEQFSPG